MKHQKTHIALSVYFSAGACQGGRMQESNEKAITSVNASIIREKERIEKERVEKVHRMINDRKTFVFFFLMKKSCPFLPLLNANE
jgi:hypothetical protein